MESGIFRLMEGITIFELTDKIFDFPNETIMKMEWSSGDLPKILGGSKNRHRVEIASGQRYYGK